MYRLAKRTKWTVYRHADGVPRSTRQIDRTIDLMARNLDQIFRVEQMKLDTVRFTKSDGKSFYRINSYRSILFRLNRSIDFQSINRRAITHPQTEGEGLRAELAGIRVANCNHPEEHQTIDTNQCSLIAADTPASASERAR